MFPGGSEGLCFAAGFWADCLLFQAAVPVLFSRIGPAVPEAFIEDRRQLMGCQLDFRAVMKAGPLFADQLRAHVSLVEDPLRDGREFPLGSAFSLADASAYHPIWFLLGMPPTRGIPRIRPACQDHGSRSGAFRRGDPEIGTRIFASPVGNRIIGRALGLQIPIPCTRVLNTSRAQGYSGPRGTSRRSSASR